MTNLHLLLFLVLLMKNDLLCGETIDDKYKKFEQSRCYDNSLKLFC